MMKTPSQKTKRKKAGLEQLVAIISLVGGLNGLVTGCVGNRGSRDSPDQYTHKILDCTTDYHVDDGDTINCKGIPIRILGIDAPEISHPKYGLNEDQPYGREALAFAERLFSTAEKITVVTGPLDKYNRVLGHVFLDDKLYALELLREGYAYETISKYGEEGFPELSKKIFQAARQGKNPPFENPSDWRKAHRK